MSSECCEEIHRAGRKVLGGSLEVCIISFHQSIHDLQQFDTLLSVDVFLRCASIDSYIDLNEPHFKA